MATGNKVGRGVAAAVGVAVLLGGTTAGAAPREQPPQPPPDRVEIIPFDIDAFAGSIADLPDPLPAPPTDGSFQTCTDVGARPAVYPLFDGQTVELPPRRDAELCAVAGADGPLWTLSWSGLVQDPSVPGTGGFIATGLWTLVGTADGWSAAMGNLWEGANWVFRSDDWDGVSQSTELRIEARYLDRSRSYRDLPPLVVEQTAPPATPAPTAPLGSAIPAQPVAGRPGYTG